MILVLDLLEFFVEYFSEDIYEVIGYRYIEVYIDIYRGFNVLERWE